MPGTSLHNRLHMVLRTLFRRQAPGETTSTGTLQVSALPTLEEILKKLDNIPENRMRFFLPEPLTDMEIFFGRDEELELLEHAFANWRGNHPTSVALVGPQGCGKTSLINVFQQKQMHDQEILRGEIGQRLWNEQLVLAFFCRLFQIDPPLDNVESLIARLLKIESKLVILEGAHNILLRVVGGRRAAEIFLYIVLRTRRQHLWLISCRRLPWRNMERHVGISRYFSHVIAVDMLSEDSMRGALHLRFEKSGLHVFFCRTREEFDQEEPSKKDESEGGEDAFHKAIFANSGHNFYAWLYFLLLSCRYDPRTRSLLLHPPDYVDMKFLKEMDRLDLLALAELSGHGVLSIDEHEQIFRMTDVQSRIIFEYLEQLRLVESIATIGTSDERTYDVSPVIHHAVTSALEQLNLLY